MIKSGEYLNNKVAISGVVVRGSTTRPPGRGREELSVVHAQGLDHVLTHVRLVVALVFSFRVSFSIFGKARGNEGKEKKRERRGREEVRRGYCNPPWPQPGTKSAGVIYPNLFAKVPTTCISVMKLQSINME